MTTKCGSLFITPQSVVYDFLNEATTTLKVGIDRNPIELPLVKIDEVYKTLGSLL